MATIEEIMADGRAKVVVCLCGAGVTMAAAMPAAESETDIAREFRKYAKQGRRIEMKAKGEKWSFCNCKGKGKENCTQSSLF